MRKSRSYRRFAAVILLVGGLCVLAIGCGVGSDGETDGQSVGPLETGSTPTVAGLSQNPGIADAEMLSTFKSKDPFIQQNVEVSTTTSTTSGGSGGVTTTTRVSPTTTYRPNITTTTRYIPWPPASTTTTKPPATTTTTAPHLHTLKILSVGDVGGAPAVTFQVDSSVYKDKRVGDVVSSSWGQIKVLDLSPTSKVATLLHGSETLVLSVGQVIYE
jgi:hypothetical protein